MGTSRPRSGSRRVRGFGGTAGTSRRAVHRIFQEYLAAKHLARLPLDQLKSYCANTGCKAPWHEVTLTLMQLLERQDDVNGLIDELRKPVADRLEEPLQQILLTRVAVAEINCSHRKACELLSQVFSWIECGQWMPLRRTLVREVAAGLESEQVAASLAARAARWFPGRVEWLYNIPSARQSSRRSKRFLTYASHCTIVTAAMNTEALLRLWRPSRKSLRNWPTSCSES